MSDFEMLSIMDDSWNCRINPDSVYKSYKKVTAPRPKVYGYFFVTK